MATKKYDPLWEKMDEKVALQGQGPSFDTHCPHCHVKVHLGASPEAGARVACGLCGGVSVIALEAGTAALQPVAA